tara:strand:- start:2 stop:223 length:222 start_codon:yes stop_codon:yes gene_type:complete
MIIRILLLVSIFLIGCSTQSKFIPIPKDSNLEWNDKFDSDKWRENYKKCQGFLHQDNDAWQWCMDNQELVYGK